MKTKTEALKNAVIAEMEQRNLYQGHTFYQPYTSVRDGATNAVNAALRANAVKAASVAWGLRGYEVSLTGFDDSVRQAAAELKTAATPAYASLAAVEALNFTVIENKAINLGEKAQQASDGIELHGEGRDEYNSINGDALGARMAAKKAAEVAV